MSKVISDDLVTTCRKGRTEKRMNDGVDRVPGVQEQRELGGVSVPPMWVRDQRPEAERFRHALQVDLHRFSTS
jgi:hypothetical protein